jgi:hypothetical protein
MLYNTLGPPAQVKSVQVDIEIEQGNRLADILELRLDGNMYRPGETLTGRLIYRPFRQERKEMSIRFALPADLPDGRYDLTACDATRAASAYQGDNPHLFAPRTVSELLDSLRQAVETRQDRLYLRLPIRRGGTALGRQEMPDLPPSRGAILNQAGLLDTRAFRQTLVDSQPGELLWRGGASASFEVRLKPTETLIRQ